LLLKAEKQQLNGVLERLFGYYLVQLGGPVKFDLLQASPIRCRIRVSPEINTDFPGLIVNSTFEDLPFASNTIDVVFLPHILEFSAHPERILQEVQRVLIPEGYIIILGFNPYSLWGLSKIKAGRFHSAALLCKWLDRNGLRVIDKRSLFFRPPLANDRLQAKLLFLESMGQLCWSSCGAVTMIMGKKRLQTLTPIRLRAPKDAVEIISQAVKPSVNLKP
jgi:SAM-dependent methyltransferase